MIGNELNELGGFQTMQRAAEAIGQILGPRAAHNVSSCWTGIGSWMH